MPTINLQEKGRDSMQPCPFFLTGIFIKPATKANQAFPFIECVRPCQQLPVRQERNKALVLNVRLKTYFEQKLRTKTEKRWE
jgi:hypothetical protein